MDTFLFVVNWIFYLFVAILGISTFLSGARLIIDIEAISIGKRTSQLIAVVIAIVAFYRIDTVPFLEEILPVLVIENFYIEWAFYLIAGAASLVCIGNLYENRNSEWETLKQDRQILGVMILFAISSLCFGFIA